MRSQGEVGSWLLIMSFGIRKRNESEQAIQIVEFKYHIHRCLFLTLASPCSAQVLDPPAGKFHARHRHQPSTHSSSSPMPTNEGSTSPWYSSRYFTVTSLNSWSPSSRPRYVVDQMSNYEGHKEKKRTRVIS